MRIFRKLAQLLDVDVTSTPPVDDDRLVWDDGAGKWVPRAGGGGGGAPTDATYITQTANGDLDNEQALSALSTGLVKVTNGTGVLSTATGGTDYANASHQHAGEDITSGTVADARIASTIARDTEVTAAIAALSSVYQAKDTTLDTYAGIDPSANVQSVLSAADYAAIRSLLGLVIGTNVQAYDADLTTYAGITPSANVQSLLGAADYAAMRTLLDVPTNAAAILDSLVDAKGDLLAGTADNTVARLAVGSDGHVLTADSGQTPGIKWAAPSGGGAVTLIQEIIAPSGGSASIDFTSISGSYRHLFIEFVTKAETGDLADLIVRFNNDSASHYGGELIRGNGSTTSAGQVNVDGTTGGFGGSVTGSSAAIWGHGRIEIPYYALSTVTKTSIATYIASANGGTLHTGVFTGVWSGTAAITRVTLTVNGGSDFKEASQFSLYGVS